MPIARWQFLAGKFWGLVWVLLVSLAVMGGSLMTVMASHNDLMQTWAGGMALTDIAVLIVLFVSLRRRPALWPTLQASWMLLSGSILAFRAGSDVELVYQGLCLVIGEGILITSIALLFSSFSTPFLSGVLTFLVFVAGRELTWLDSLSERLHDAGLARLVAVISQFFPNCYLFVPSVNVLEGRIMVTSNPEAPWILVAHATSYGLLYSAIILGLAGLILWRRDFV